MRRRSLAATLTVLLPVIMTACADAAPSPTPNEASSTAPSGESTPQAPSASPVDLADVVISPDEPPAGMTLDSDREGQVLGRLPLSPSRAADLQAHPGFVTGRYATFSGSAGFLLSWAAQFASDAEAAGAASIVLEELQSDDGYGWGIGDDAGLGDEGTCLEGDNPREGGLHETICVWRNGSLVLVVGGDSSEEAIPSIAQEIDMRADVLTSR